MNFFEYVMMEIVDFLDFVMFVALSALGKTTRRSPLAFVSTPITNMFSFIDVPIYILGNHLTSNIQS